MATTRLYQRVRNDIAMKSESKKSIYSPRCVPTTLISPAATLTFLGRIRLGPSVLEEPAADDSEEGDSLALVLSVGS
jgi:hypothetical protein